MTIKLGSVGESVREWQEFLASIGLYESIIDSKFGNKTHNATIEFQKKYGLDSDGKVGVNTKAKAIELGFTYPVQAGEITKDQLKKIMTSASNENIEKYIAPLNMVMKKYEINTYLRQAHFIAQIAHESGSLKYSEEIADGSDYENRTDLGNINPGDGKNFKGRGLVQLTGRANYIDYGDFIGIDLEANPGQVESDPNLCVDVAGWYWKKRNINIPADQDDVITVTKKINGGTNGLDDRKQFLQKAKSTLKSEVKKAEITEADDIFTKIADLTYDQWKEIFSKHLEWSKVNNRVSGTPAWQDQNDTINVIGIRCNKEVDINRAKYNDYLVVIFNKSLTDFTKVIMEVTTDPATDAQGRAHLRQGMWNSYVIRPHAPGGNDERVFPVNGRQKRWGICQNQNAGEVEVVRTDGNGNQISTERGRFGINIHDNGGYRDSSIGCTVIKSDTSYMNLLLPLIYDIEGNKKIPVNHNSITYCLINQDQFTKY